MTDQGAVVEAMARAIQPWVGDDTFSEPFSRVLAQAALSAALATGSVVICTPELKALMAKIDRYADLERTAPGCPGEAGAAGHVLQAALAFVRTSQES